MITIQHPRFKYDYSQASFCRMQQNRAVEINVQTIQNAAMDFIRECAKSTVTLGAVLYSFGALQLY